MAADAVPTANSQSQQRSERAEVWRMRIPGLWVRIALVVAGGGLLYAASPPHHLWWLAPLAFVAVVVALDGRCGRAGFGYGTLFGAAYLLPLLKWLYDFLGADFGVWPWLALVALESVFFGLAGAGMARVSRLPRTPGWLAPVWMAAVVVLAEALRSRVPWGGFPWGKVAFTQPEGVFLPLASLGGAPLVTFAVALTGCALGLLVVRWGYGWVTPGMLTALAVLPVVAGLVTLPTIGTGPATRQATVAIVQGNAPNVGVDLMNQNDVVRANHIAETEQLAAGVRSGRLPRPDLVVLPESSDVWGVPRSDPDLDRLAGAFGVPMAVGGVAYGPHGEVSNRMIRWDPHAGPTTEYAKQHLVAFSEFIPLRAVAGLVTPFLQQFPRDMSPGDRPGVFAMGPARLGLAICYEVAYDDVFTDAVRDGANLLAVPTNNAWFGRTEMSYQQLAMSSLRAVEHDRAVVVAATSGVSAVVRPDGTVTHATGQFTADAVVTKVPLSTGTTIATRLGDIPEWGLAALGAAAVAASAVRPGQGRRQRA